MTKKPNKGGSRGGSLRNGRQRAALLRGVALKAIDRATANSDAKGAISQALGTLANVLECGTWPITDAALDTLLGPVQRDPTCRSRERGVR